MHLRPSPLLALLLLVGASPIYATAPAARQAQAAAAMTAPALYDKSKDTLSVEASAVPLKEILGYIAMQSGIEVLFDGRADRPVTAKFKNRPFEEALKNLLSQSNYSLRYSDKKKGKKPMLIGVKVLPAGNNDGNATPLLALRGEAFIQEKNLRDPEEANRRSLSYERWKARLAELNPKLREKIEKEAKDRLDAQEKRKADRERMREEMRARNQQRQSELDASRQDMENAKTPEQKALTAQRRDAAKAMAQQNNM